MLTSEDADAMLDLAMEKGANGYALKPVTLEELDAAIKRVMPEK